MTQSALAFPGCTVGYISRLEAGARTPSLQVVHELARRLGVSETWLANGDEGGGGDEGDLRDADLALRLDDLDAAAEVYERLAEDDGPAAVRAAAEAGLGQIAFRRDDTGGAVEHLERAFALEPELGDPAHAETLGRAYALLGQESEAIALFRRRLDRARELRDTVQELRFAVLLANAQIDAGLFGEAANLIGTAIANAGDGDPVSLARLYWTQSRFHTLRGSPSLAARYARRALALLEATEHTLYQARAHQVLAHIELDRGNADVALELLERGRGLLGRLGTPHDDAKFAIEEARALARLGRVDEAVELASGAASFAGGHPVDRGRCWSELAAIAAESDPDRSVDLYERAIEALADPPSRYLIEACVGCAAVFERVGRDREALELYKRAASLRVELELAAG